MMSPVRKRQKYKSSLI